MQIQFCGASGSVTGSCFLVTTESSKFLVDCGLFQGSKALKELNYGSFIFDPETIDFVLLTHAHVDHSGLLPKLYKKGFRGEIYATKATTELCSVVLPDSAHIQEMEVERKNRKLARSGEVLLEPIYTVEDAQKCINHFVGCYYEKEFNPAPGIVVKYYDAGHILGSAMIEIMIYEEGRYTKLVFTGDIGNTNQALVEDPTKIKDADVVIMEATYGNRYHLDGGNKLQELARVVNQTMQKGGNLVIPSFAVERTQDLVYYLKIMKDNGEISPMDIYIDSPMAVEATKVFIRNPEYFDEEVSATIKGQGAEELFVGPDIHYVISAEESIEVNKIKSGAIIISASGMADAGRIKHHLKHNLWRQESTILFVGYQAEGTLGRRILEGENKVKIHGEEIAVKATIERIDDFSAHADQKGLIEWLRGFEQTPGKVILVHGEAESLKSLQRVIRREIGIQAQVAEYGMIYTPSDEAGLFTEKELNTYPAKVTAILEPELGDALTVIKREINRQGKIHCSDTKILQRLMAHVSEIERELQKCKIDKNKNCR